MQRDHHLDHGLRQQQRSTQHCEAGRRGEDHAEVLEQGASPQQIAQPVDAQDDLDHDRTTQQMDGTGAELPREGQRHIRQHVRQGGLAAEHSDAHVALGGFRAHEPTGAGDRA